MRRKQCFVPAVDGLESREVLSTITPHILPHVAVTNVSVRQIDSTIPFVIAPTGVWQNAINFTSNTYHNLINGLNSAAKSFARTGDVTALGNALTALSNKVPYGQLNLLPVWQADVENGTTIGGTLQQIKADLLSYLNEGLGTDWNVLKSCVNWSTDSQLTYNGRVG
jgi:hypothetical protein